MRDPRRVFDLGEKGRSLRGQFAQPRPAVPVVDGALDEVAGRQSFKRPGCRRPVQRDIGGQCGLIGGFAHRKRRKQAVLQRRHLELAAGFLEQRDVNLMQAPDQKSRPL